MKEPEKKECALLFLLFEMLEKTNKSIVTENSSMVSSARGGQGEKGEITKGHKETFGLVDMFLIMTMVSWMYIYVTSHQLSYFKYV